MNNIHKDIRNYNDDDDNNAGDDIDDSNNIHMIKTHWNRSVVSIF